LAPFHSCKSKQHLKFLSPPPQKAASPSLGLPRQQQQEKKLAPFIQIKDNKATLCDKKKKK